MRVLYNFIKKLMGEKMNKKTYFTNECPKHVNAGFFVELPREIKSICKNLENKCKDRRMPLEIGIYRLRMTAKNCGGSIQIREPYIYFLLVSGKLNFKWQIASYSDARVKLAGQPF